MKIIISESQHRLLRRMGLYGEYLRECLYWNDPCEYSRYYQYRRIVINESLARLVTSEQLLNVFKTVLEIDAFKENVLIPLFDDLIKNYYDSFQDKC